MVAKLMIRRRFGWALLPTREEIPRKFLVPIANEDEFRWHSNGRREEQCLPRNLGLGLGLHIVSPVDINLSPLAETNFSCRDDELPQAIADFGLAECWNRGSSRIGFRYSTGFKAYDFKVSDTWESMFVPNGQGTFEWRMGFDILVEDDVGLLIAPAETTCGVTALYGFLSPNSLRRMNSSGGFSIAMRCTSPTSIRRGDRIARVIPVPLRALKLQVDIADELDTKKK